MMTTILIVAMWNLQAMIRACNHSALDKFALKW